MISNMSPNWPRVVPKGTNLRLLKAVFGTFWLDEILTVKIFQLILFTSGPVAALAANIPF